MIKLNLLPQYVIEFRRIRVLIIVFVAVLLLEGTVVYTAYTDLQKQAKWFTDDKGYFTARKSMIDGEKSKADELNTKSASYQPYIDFFTRGPVVKYNEGIVTSLQEVAKMVGGGPAWFDDLTLADTNVTMNGKIKGLMNFVNFYFKMSDTGMKVTPAAHPAPSADASTVKNTMAQVVPLVVVGTIKTALPKPPAPPDKAMTPSELYIPATAAGAAAGTPGAPGAPGAAAAGTPTPGPGAMPGGLPPGSNVGPPGMGGGGGTKP